MINIRKYLLGLAIDDSRSIELVLDLTSNHFLGHDWTNIFAGITAFVVNVQVQVYSVDRGTLEMIRNIHCAIFYMDKFQIDQV